MEGHKICRSHHLLGRLASVGNNTTSAKMVLQKENDVETIVEVREDEEQAIKLRSIIDLLLAAGYFRARIKGISPFDKVVGGMTWCIEICNYEIDIDLLFQENLSIGQKIALTEKIVAVLPIMGCPYSLEPHQIQGLDCINIFPVVQWLVKRAMEVRAETGDYVRAFSLFQFQKDETLVPASQVACSETLTRTNDIYRPVRSFKCIPVQSNRSIKEQVKGTLFEYGLLPDAGRVTKAEPSQDLAASFMQIQPSKENRVSYQAVSQVIGRRIHDVVEAVQNYGALQSEREAAEASSIPGLKRTKARLEEQVEKAQAEYTASVAKLSEIQEERRTFRVQKASLDERERRLQELETEENKPILDELKRLVQESETLKVEERNFKQHCKTELEKLERQIEEAERANQEATERPVEEIIQEQEAWKEKLVEARKKLASKSRAVAALERKLDAVPSRAELTQYQRRFLELYQQVSSKHKETKQYYILYNTLDDTRLYISKELNLLNSLVDNYERAMQNQSSKEEYVQQLEVVAQGVQASQLKVKRELDKFREKRNCLAASLQELTDLQRRYKTTVRDLREEFKRHEYLLSQFPPSFAQ